MKESIQLPNAAAKGRRPKIAALRESRNNGGLRFRE